MGHPCPVNVTLLNHSVITGAFEQIRCDCNGRHRIEEIYETTQD